MRGMGPKASEKSGKTVDVTDPAMKVRIAYRPWGGKERAQAVEALTNAKPKPNARTGGGVPLHKVRAKKARLKWEKVPEEKCITP